jgi:hypothetical protein
MLNVDTFANRYPTTFWEVFKTAVRHELALTVFRHRLNPSKIILWKPLQAEQVLTLAGKSHVAVLRAKFRDLFLNLFP